LGSAAVQDAWLVLGKIGKVHGIKGWVRVISFTEEPDGILDYPILRAEPQDGAFGRSELRMLEIDDYRQQPKGLIVHFKGIDTPEEARLCNGALLSVEREALPQLEQEEFYWYELEGLAVVNLQQERFGVVKGLLETGANDVLVVAPDADSIDKRERLIPYLRDDVVKQIDLDAGVISVEWGADFLA
jgi:16S rRNA processing protein RimM